MKIQSYSALKQKIEKEIQKLHKQAEALQRKRRGPAIENIVKTMREYDITPEEIAVAFQQKPSRRAPTARKVAAPAKKAAKKIVVPAKYRDPQTGATWTGRGKAPRWLADAEANGTSRDSFLIK
ncbi:MAG: H-NS family nucleoid-associated regulatory protein [Burkholderiaceae bacterium]|jgi:DNA-binding protein H-NS